MISNQKKALIHVAKAKTGMTEEEYRALLESVGVSSSKELDTRTFAQVIDRFKELGFVSMPKKRNIHTLPTGKKALMKKLEAILLDMGLDWPYVDSIAKSRFKVDRAQWLAPEPLRKLVQMMAVHQKRTADRRTKEA